MVDEPSEPVTMYRIAREAGVSPATVSRVINGTRAVSSDKRQRIEEIIRRYDYRPSALARGLSGANTHTLGFIQPDISHPYYNALFVAAEQAALDLGYTVLLGNTLNDNTRRHNNMEVKYIRLMQQKRVDGLVISGGRINDVDLGQDYMDEVRRCIAQTPIITVSGRNPWMDTPSVSVDEPHGIRLMVNYLVSLKHERLGFLGGIRGILPTDTRVPALRAALTDHGLEYRESWHIESGFGIEEGASAMQTLLALKDRPTAVLCFNDLTAIGAIFATQRAGLRVPDDISIAGIDNIDIGRFVRPSITTVDLRGPEQGRIAIGNLVARLRGESTETHTVVTPRLVVRTSCAGPE